MATQTLLTAIALLTLSIFTICFFLDLVATITQAWDSATITTTETPISQEIPQLNYADLSWIKSQHIDESFEICNAIEMAKARMPKIITLPQTPEAKELEKWLNTVPKVNTPKLEYSTLAAMKVSQLRCEAKVKNVKNAGSMLKKDLIVAILEA